MFPPCYDVLVQQIKHQWIVARLYKSATTAEFLVDVSPLDYGYELYDDQIQIKWFEGEQVPAVIEEEECDDIGEND